VTGAIDEHRVIIVDAADDVVAVNDGLVAAFFLKVERGQNRSAACRTSPGIRNGFPTSRTIVQ